MHKLNFKNHSDSVRNGTSAESSDTLKSDVINHSPFGLLTRSWVLFEGRRGAVTSRLCLAETLLQLALLGTPLEAASSVAWLEIEIELRQQTTAQLVKPQMLSCNLGTKDWGMGGISPSRLLGISLVSFCGDSCWPHFWLKQFLMPLRKLMRLNTLGIILIGLSCERYDRWYV